MEPGESPDGRPGSELTEEDRKYLKRRESFAEKNAKKYGSIEEAKAVFDHWS